MCALNFYNAIFVYAEILNNLLHIIFFNQFTLHFISHFHSIFFCFALDNKKMIIYFLPFSFYLAINIKQQFFLLYFSTHNSLLYLLLFLFPNDFLEFFINSKIFLQFLFILIFFIKSCFSSFLF